MSVQEATEKCLEALSACLEVKQLKTDGWAEDRLAHLNLWIAGLAGLGSSRVSLDTRLDSQPETRDLIARLLGLLALNVDKCRAIAVGSVTESDEDEGYYDTSSDESPSRPCSPWIDKDDADPEGSSSVQAEQPLPSTTLLEDNMQDVEIFLKQLDQIAVMVRKSGKGSRLQRADQQFKPEEHKDLQAQLTTMMLLNNMEQHSDPDSSKAKLDPSNLSDIQERIIQSNLKRRNRFLYAQRHSDSPSGRTSRDEYTRRPQEELIPASSAKSASDSVGSQSQIPVLDAAIDKVKGQPNLMRVSGTRATAFSNSPDISQVTSPSSAAAPTLFSSTAGDESRATSPLSTAASTLSSSTAGDTSRVTSLLLTAPSTLLSSAAVSPIYPQPPQMVSGMRTFTCPCCCQSLPGEYSDENRWKEHISNDLSPYTCILRGCTSPSVLYTTRSDWQRHLLDRHQGCEYWVCFSCEGTEQFSNKEQFTRHIEVYHSSFMRSGQISLLIDVCRRHTPLDITSCPLCNWPEGHGQQRGVDKTRLLDHIAKELHAFSLRSLPWNDDSGQKVIKEYSRAPRGFLNGSTGTLYAQKPRLRGFHSSSYLQHNPYFVDDWYSGSSSILESYAFLG